MTPLKSTTTTTPTTTFVWIWYTDHIEMDNTYRTPGKLLWQLYMTDAHRVGENSDPGVISSSTASSNHRCFSPSWSKGVTIVTCRWSEDCRPLTIDRAGLCMHSCSSITYYQLQEVSFRRRRKGRRANSRNTLSVATDTQGKGVRFT